MTARKTEITRADIMPMTEFARVRAERRRALVAVKKNRRVSVGPFATFYFENYDTMWHQIHEMLHIEKGGEEQIADELRAYNPLIPKGNELVATIMFEIDNAVQRQRILSRLGGVEHTMSLQFAGHTVPGRPEGDVERTNEAGKTSSVHFMHFAVTPEQAAAFRTPGTQVIVAIGHPDYGHMAVMPEAVRAELAGDLD
ncbi:DUF3501 family protein [Azospirillum halopraeferens]|uniref:DUF3501 family protein n=1 Tax=Azospirillum halopraeferens TaxID=34010 RepID=UPI0003FD200C|nr:DUF3501 family protein [Azospirillum halopraeferens]